MMRENQYRTHNCGELRESDIGKNVRVAGWVENIRDHGGVMFLDIRDQYGVVQVVVHDDNLLKDINKECTVTIEGEDCNRYGRGTHIKSQSARQMQGKSSFRDLLG